MIMSMKNSNDTIGNRTYDLLNQLRYGVHPHKQVRYVSATLKDSTLKAIKDGDTNTGI